MSFAVIDGALPAKPKVELCKCSHRSTAHDSTGQCRDVAHRARSVGGSRPCRCTRFVQADKA